MGVLLSAARHACTGCSARCTASSQCWRFLVLAPSIRAMRPLDAKTLPASLRMCEAWPRSCFHMSRPQDQCAIPRRAASVLPTVRTSRPRARFPHPMSRMPHPDARTRQSGPAQVQHRPPDPAPLSEFPHSPVPQPVPLPALWRQEMLWSTGRSSTSDGTCSARPI